MNSMRSLTELQQIIRQTIVEKQYTGHPKELYEPINYLMGLGGKRIRPVLLLMACNIFSDDIRKAINPALAIEVFHNFTLMHDDIMDNAPLRRNKPTVHEKWNRNAGILSGDAMLVEAYKLIMQVEPEILKQVLNIFNKTAIGVCEGQQIDMNFENINHVEISEYINMIRLKTAVLLGGALEIGALIGGSNEADGDLLHEFGVNLGIAFQLKDDILDIYGDPKKFGKQVGGDILSNKKTFMLIKAQELAKDAMASSLNAWISNHDQHSIEKIDAVTAIYDSLEVRKLAELEMTGFAKKALHALDQVSVETSKKESLQSFAKQLLVRES